MIHEVAHGWVAFRCGDPTAKIMGRLTLNPLKHIDKYGSIIVPAVLLLVNSPALFGWAKPVPINLNRCRNPKDALFQVSIAGPMSNLLQAILALVILKIIGPANQWFTLFSLYYAQTNVMLMAFNLIPIPPPGWFSCPSFLAAAARSRHPLADGTLQHVHPRHHPLHRSLGSFSSSHP